MTKRHGILGDTAINSAAMAMCLVGGLGTQALLAWQLGPSGRGEYGVWLAMATIVAILFSLGADRAIQVFLIASRITVAQAVTSVLLVSLSSTVVGCAIIGCAARADGSFLEDVLPKPIGIALLVVPAVVLPTALHLLLIGLRYFTAAAILNLLRTVSQLGLAAFFLVKLDWATEGAFASYGISAAAYVIGALVFLHRKNGKILERLPSDVCMQMSWYAVKYLPARLGRVVNGNLVILLLAFFATKDEVGFYSLAVVLMGQFLIVSDALNQSLMPRIGTALDGQADLVAKCCRYSLLLYGILLVSGVSVLSWMMPILFSPKFQDSILLLWILTPGVWLRGATRSLLAYFICVNRPAVVSIATTIELAFTALAITLLYPIDGVHGATAAASLGYGCGASVLAIAFHKCSKQSLAETWWVRSAERRAVKDHLVAWLGIRLKRRTFFSETAAAKCDSTQVERKVVITPTRVVKTQPHSLFQLELARSAIIATIAQQSNAFRVPRILGVNETESSIEFERLRYARPLSKGLGQGLQTDDLLIRTGQVLALIHNGLTVAPDKQCALPQRWLPTHGLSNVGLHGDFTVNNVLYCSRMDQLYVIDCATSDLCGGRASFGPWGFDVAWFIGSLLQRRGLRRRPVAELATRANLFLNAYCQESREYRSKHEFQAYCRDISTAFMRSDARNTPTVLRRSHTNPPPLKEIWKFAHSLMSDLPSLKDVA